MPTAAWPTMAAASASSDGGMRAAGIHHTASAEKATAKHLALEVIIKLLDAHAHEVQLAVGLAPDIFFMVALADG